MPNKYPDKKGWKLSKQRYKVSNWSHYNDALRQRGSIDVWIAADIADTWYESNRVNNGAGAPRKFTDSAILTCHEIRQVFKLALRQSQGFINSLFKLKGFDLKSPDYSCFSKRLATLKIDSPRYKKAKVDSENIAAIAIDSAGLKRFGRGEWHQEKHKVSAKRSWRKLHIAVDGRHIIHGSDLTDRFSHDCKSVEPLAKQVNCAVSHVTADGAYDKSNHAERNRNLQEIKTFGRMVWQRVRNYGRRNISELAIQRYKKILGVSLHSRELARQKQESMIGCGILNKLTQLGMPISYRCA